MPPLDPETPSLTVEQYLEGELASEVRHEYIDGQVYAMVGASRAHARIVTSLSLSLGPRARDRGCDLFLNDMKVRLEVRGQDIFYYPDLVLTCDPADDEEYFVTAPCLIVEVLSPGTERIDRREKRFAYTTIDSLREYLLVDPDRRHVEIHRRRDDWHPEVVTEGRIRLESLAMDVPLETLYEDLPAD